MSLFIGNYFNRLDFLFQVLGMRGIPNKRIKKGEVITQPHLLYTENYEVFLA